MRTVKIYSLSSSNNPEEIRYIGKTVCKLCKRLANHKKSALRDLETTHLYNWFRKEFESGNKVDINLIEEVPIQEYNNNESFWISDFLNRGFDLTNCKQGDENKCLEYRKYNFSSKSLDNIRNAARKRRGEGRPINPDAIEIIKNNRKNITIDSIKRAKITREQTMIKNKQTYGSCFPKLKLEVKFSSGNIKIFDSISNAAKELKINYNTLYTSIKKNRNLRKEYKFSLIN